MPKHRADRQLTHENWDAEEDPEEPGEFAQASEDVMKQRKIKRAVRRTNSGAATAGGGAFSGFGGFGGLNSDSLFSNKASTNGSTAATGTVSAAIKMFEPKTTTADKTGGVNGVEKKGDNSGYLKQLKALNEGVLAWIKQHVDKNPYCLLTPIFGDYEKHLLEIEKKYPKKGSDEKVESNDKEQKTEDTSKEKSEDKPTSIFSAPTTTEAQPSPFSAFKFGTISKSEFKPSFSFGAAAVTSENTPITTTTATDQGEGEEEYVPPKAEVKTIVEEGSVYTKRCKLFYQKDGAWADKGVGNIHLKVVDGAAQIVVRADTNLGNLLLNVRLTKTLPANRQGKNNVTIMCVPNPPLDPNKTEESTPVPFLIRVKTGDDADELLNKINELKK